VTDYFSFADLFCCPACETFSQGYDEFYRHHRGAPAFKQIKKKHLFARSK
jgi:hypothetical protein